MVMATSTRLALAREKSILSSWHIWNMWPRIFSCQPGSLDCVRDVHLLNQIVSAHLPTNTMPHSTMGGTDCTTGFDVNNSGSVVSPVGKGNQDSFPAGWLIWYILSICQNLLVLWWMEVWPYSNAVSLTTTTGLWCKLKAQFRLGSRLQLKKILAWIGVKWFYLENLLRCSLFGVRLNYL